MYKIKKMKYLIIFPLIFMLSSCAGTQWSDTGADGQAYDVASFNCGHEARARVRAEGVFGAAHRPDGLSDFDLEQREMENCLYKKGFRRVAR